MTPGQHNGLVAQMLGVKRGNLMSLLHSCWREGLGKLSSEVQARAVSHVPTGKSGITVTYTAFSLLCGHALHFLPLDFCTLFSET